MSHIEEIGFGVGNLSGAASSTESGIDCSTFFANAEKEKISEIPRDVTLRTHCIEGNQPVAPKGLPQEPIIISPSSIPSGTSSRLSVTRESVGIGSSVGETVEFCVDVLSPSELDTLAKSATVWGKMIIGEPVFARWSDKKYYSGVITKIGLNDTWHIAFEDHEKAIASHGHIIPLRKLGVGVIGVYCPDKVYAPYTAKIVGQKRCNSHPKIKPEYTLEELQSTLYAIECTGLENPIWCTRRQLVIEENVAQQLHREFMTSPEFAKRVDISEENIIQGKRKRPWATAARPSRTCGFDARIKTCLPAHGQNVNPITVGASENSDGGSLIRQMIQTDDPAKKPETPSGSGRKRRATDNEPIVKNDDGYSSGESPSPPGRGNHHGKFPRVAHTDVGICEVPTPSQAESTVLSPESDSSFKKSTFCEFIANGPPRKSVDVTFGEDGSSQPAAAIVAVSPEESVIGIGSSNGRAVEFEVDALSPSSMETLDIPAATLWENMGTAQASPNTPAEDNSDGDSEIMIVYEVVHTPEEGSRADLAEERDEASAESGEDEVPVYTTEEDSDSDSE